FVEYDSDRILIVGCTSGNGLNPLNSAGPLICDSYAGEPSRTSTSSPHAIDSKPRRRKSITIPGHVSSASTAHQSCPITLTSRTRTGRFRSPRVARNVVRFFAALFMIGKTVPSLLEQYLHCSSLQVTEEIHLFVLH